MEAKIKTNRLWQARHKVGLEQKQVARLLGHKTCDQISRYERGDRLPSFKTALKLEIILHASVRELFPDLYEHHRTQIAERTPALQASLPFEQESTEHQTGSHICTFEALALQKEPTDKAINLARKHTMKVMRVLGEVINARNKRAED